MVQLELIFQISWNIAGILFLLLYPIAHTLLGRGKIKSVFFHSLFLLFLILALDSVIIGLKLYSNTVVPGLSDILIIIAILYILRLYPVSTLITYSPNLPVEQVNNEVLDAVMKGVRGKKSQVPNLFDEEINGSFTITTPYRLSYEIEVGEGDNAFFIVSSSISIVVKLVNLLIVYLGTYSLINSKTIFVVPATTTTLDIPTTIVFLIFGSLVIMYLEYTSSLTLGKELVLLYRRLLQKQVNRKMNSLESESVAGELPEEEDPSELEKARERARKILESRKFDVLSKKRQQLKDKVDTIFEKDIETQSFDLETIERIRLVNAVKRATTSTPPWTKVSLSQIAELVDGEEEEVELIITNLRQQGEIPGIYDIWKKMYFGVKDEQWIIHQTLNKSEEHGMNVNHIMVHPDGKTEVSFNSKNDLKKENEFEEEG